MTNKTVAPSSQGSDYPRRAILCLMVSIGQQTGIVWPAAWRGLLVRLASLRCSLGRNTGGLPCKFAKSGGHTTARVLQYHQSQAVHRCDASSGMPFLSLSVPVQGCREDYPNWLFAPALFLAWRPHRRPWETGLPKTKNDSATAGRPLKRRQTTNQKIRG